MTDYDIKVMRAPEDEGGYLAYIPQLDCWGDGETEIEAVEEVKAVAGDILEIAFENLNNIVKEFPTCDKATKSLSDALIKVGVSIEDLQFIESTKNLLDISIDNSLTLKEVVDEYNKKESKINATYKKKNKKLKNWEKNKFYQR